jgi:pyridoxine kinase
LAILSIQSHVAYGHVGNRAAVFPLERLGYEVWPINTVQFSNHAGYESLTGEVFTAAHLDLVWSGVKAMGHVADCEAVLSGYLGAAEVGQFVLRAVDDVKAANPAAIYCCDPVMGDYGTGVFVAPGIVDFFSGHALRSADIVTPNQFEAELLTGSVISSIEDAKRACASIHEHGPSIVLITSFKPKEKNGLGVSMFLSSPECSRVLTTPELALDPLLKGLGDLAAALFLARYLEVRDPVSALESMADSLFAVLERTQPKYAKELSLISAQGEIAEPKKRFCSAKV